MAHSLGVQIAKGSHILANWEEKDFTDLSSLLNVIVKVKQSINISLTDIIEENQDIYKNDKDNSESSEEFTESENENTAKNMVIRDIIQKEKNKKLKFQHKTIDANVVMGQN